MLVFSYFFQQSQTFVRRSKSANEMHAFSKGVGKITKSCGKTQFHVSKQVKLDV